MKEGKRVVSIQAGKRGVEEKKGESGLVAALSSVVQEREMNKE